MIEGTTYHLVSYYHPSDVRSGLLQTPSTMPHLAHLEISQAVLNGLAEPVPSAGSGGKAQRSRSGRAYVPSFRLRAEARADRFPPTTVTLRAKRQSSVVPRADARS